MDIRGKRPVRNFFSAIVFYTKAARHAARWAIMATWVYLAILALAALILDQGVVYLIGLVTVWGLSILGIGLLAAGSQIVWELIQSFRHEDG